jgi:hypothetical protein
MNIRRSKDVLSESHEYGQILSPWTLRDERRVNDFLDYTKLYFGNASPAELRSSCYDRLLRHIRVLAAHEASAMVAAAQAIPDPFGGEAIRALWLRAIKDRDDVEFLGLQIGDLRTALAEGEALKAFKRLLRRNREDCRTDRHNRETMTGTGSEESRRGVATILGHVLADDRLRRAGVAAALTLAGLTRRDVAATRGLDSSLPAIGLLSPAAWTVLLDYVIAEKSLGEVAAVVPLRRGRVGASKSFVCTEALRIGGFAVRRIARNGRETPASRAWRLPDAAVLPPMMSHTVV